MPSQHKTPLVGWHPPADLGDWLRAQAAQRDVPLSAILNEIVAEAKAGGDLLVRCDSLLSLIRHRESSGLSPQTIHDLDELLGPLRARTDRRPEQR